MHLAPGGGADEYAVLDRFEGRIGIRSLLPAGAARRHGSAPVVVWLPGRLGACDEVLLGEPGEPRQALADAGLPVYSVDYRTHFVRDDHPPDFEACARWTLTVFLQDVDHAVGYVRARHPDQPLVLVGHSVGAKLAYLHTARQPPGALAGLITLDGWLREPPDLVTAADRAAVLASHHELGDGAGAGSRSLASRRLGPDDESRRQRLLAAHLRRSLLDAPNPTVGRMIGSAADEASINRVVECLLVGDCHWPAILEMETRAMAVGVVLDGLPRHDANLAGVTAPLLNLVAGDRGADFTRRALLTGRLLERATRSEVVLDDFGHMDLVVGGHLGGRVSEEILQWVGAKIG
jgi:pimeloyl-ACP methyl ester carboxylesterase